MTGTGTTIHGTCVAFGDLGVLLRGPSGAGKSDLALRLIEAGAVLVADDRVALRRRGDGVAAFAPAELAGRLEVRGLGLIDVPCAAEAGLRLVCDLVPARAIERLPQPRRCEYLEVRIRRLDVSAFEASATAKIRLAAYGAAGLADPVTGGRSDAGPDLRTGDDAGNDTSGDDTSDGDCDDRDEPTT